MYIYIMKLSPPMRNKNEVSRLIYHHNLQAQKRSIAVLHCCTYTHIQTTGKMQAPKREKTKKKTINEFEMRWKRSPTAEYGNTTHGHSTHTHTHNWEVFNIIRFDSFCNRQQINAEFYTICFIYVRLSVRCVHELHDSNLMSNYFTTFLSLHRSFSMKKSNKLIKMKQQHKKTHDYKQFC